MAVPTAPRSTCVELEREVDEAVCLTTPEPFFGVGQWYVDFSQTTDDEVISLLREPRLSDDERRASVNTRSGSQEREVEITLGSTVLKGTLELVPGRPGIVLFVHGSGSSRFSSRNRAVARDLQSGGLSTLLFDLLSEDEERIDEITRELRFDIGLLTDRVIGVTDWLRQQQETRNLGSATSGPAPEGRPPSRRPRTSPIGPRWCGRSCLAAAGPTWPWRRCRW